MAVLFNIKPNGKVDVWDFGPGRPNEPEEPKALGKDATLLQKIEHKDAMAAHEEAIKSFIDARKHHHEWHTSNGGPVRIELWPADVRHALQVEPNRYFLKLTAGQKPGKAQMEADAMAAAEMEDMQRAALSDPQFGREAQGVAQ